MKLSVKAFALSCGIIWGVGLLALALWVTLLGVQGEHKTLLERVYLGYRFTALGSLVGLAWGLADGLIGGAVFAWLYNKLVGSPA